MSLFKKLFGKKEPSWKTRPIKPIASKESTPNIENTSTKVVAENEENADTSSIDKSVKDNLDAMISEGQVGKKLEWMAKNQKIEDEDLVNQSLEIIFPRLKRGLIGDPKPQSMVINTPKGEQEITLPAELMMAGFNSGPDFSTCLAIDHEAMFTMIYNKHITLSGKSKEELLQLAANNFLRVHSQTINVSQTIFEGVYELKTDGNSEASTFLFPTIWTNIMTQLGLNSLFVVIPAQNTVLFWDQISDQTLAELTSKVTEVVNSYPKGSLVSNYKYQFLDNGFKHLEQIFKINL